MYAVGYEGLVFPFAESPEGSGGQEYCKKKIRGTEEVFASAEAIG